MKKLLAGIIMLAAPLTAAHAETLKIGVDLTYPPYNYFDDANQPAGFDVELMKLIGKKTGSDVSFHDTRFENLILGVSSDQFNVIASTLYVTAARAKQIDYIPYMKTGVSIAVSAAGGQNFTKPEELCGKRVGSIKGAAWIPELEKLNTTVCAASPIDSREFPTSPEATQAVMSGGVDAQLENSAVLADAAKKLNGRLKVTSTEQLYPVIVGFGVKKGNTEVASFLRDTLAKLDGDADYEALFAKYGVAKSTDAEFKAAVGH
ncbi:transporter substrate-binding domain-containing protein [Rhizobium sp. 16-449-1b]|uniref:transporter substrate-binding domain-containing protein n=1 Tax=Rhizobium sp. 16-449-1b TaxID=2819989 RepID=UPI001ADAC27D|nr:transporter substrate-binding domain-containing protein [Rhizobium sp. 16-449-1b]MBO9196736.1 transporter substrate-binding domain-containing protein [Rhizobium sp. 16-449-1b]